MIDNCPGECEKEEEQMALRKKKASQATKKKKQEGADFGAALVKARQDTDHIFKQASEDEGFSNSADEMPLLPAQSAESNSANPRRKAAAWAWHQRGGGGGSGASTPEKVRNRALVVVRRSSRFKAEALRINASYTADDTVSKAEHKWDPHQSLFDSYELLSVARELDKALNQQASVAAASSQSSMTKSRSSSSHSGVDPKPPLGRLLRLLSAPVLCLSEDDVATKTSFKKKAKNPSMGSGSSSSGAFEKAIQLLRYSPPSSNFNAQEQQHEEEHRHHHHEHFHHHHHHHHHHVDVLSVPERS